MNGSVIGVVDYARGNLLSIMNALRMIPGVKLVLCRTPEQIMKADRIILPGVGAFGDGMANLKFSGLIEPLREAALNKKKPFLGICLGMQLLARKGYESGVYDGLGWIDGEAIRLAPEDPKFKVPHVGWNDVQWKSNSPIFQGLPEFPDFYFVHSYYLKCDATHIDATVDYGGRVTAAIRKENIAGVQFHPEKSQDMGLKILENFVNWNP